MTVNTQELYGAVLSDYVHQCSSGAGIMYSVDAFDGDQRRADWLLVNGDSGLIIEVKRALATGTLSRHLLTANGMCAVLKQLYGAYDQCPGTREPTQLEASLRSTSADSSSCSSTSQ